jgi:hypothetical protein
MLVSYCQQCQLSPRAAPWRFPTAGIGGNAHRIQRLFEKSRGGLGRHTDPESCLVLLQNEALLQCL